MNRPPPHAPAPTVPGWMLLAGAALAACLATLLPGLVLLLESFDRSLPDLHALIPELLVGAVMSAFGAVQLRAQCLGRGRWAGGLLVAANLALIAFAGIAIDLSLSSGSTVSGPAFLIGLVVIIGVVFANALLAGLTWWILAALARRITSNPSAPDTRVRVATWLLAAAAAHVVVKGVSGGPVVFGMLAAIVAAGLLLTTQGPARPAVLGGAALVVVAGLGATAVTRLRDMRRESIANIAQCTESTYPTTTPGGGLRDHDVLARAARGVPGVADAASDTNRLPNGSSQVTVYVLPDKGGPLAPPLASAVEGAIAGVKCTEASDGSRPAVVVQAARRAPFVVRAHVVARPDADEARVRASVSRAIHDTFDLDAAPPRFPAVAPRPHVTSRERAGRFGLGPVDPGVVFLQLHVGDAWLEDYVRQLPPGSVPVVERVDIEIAAPAPEPDATAP